MYLFDEMRHVICVPYSVEGLHAMARDLGIKRCWFHRSPLHPHYDLPKKLIEPLSHHPRMHMVTPRELLSVIKAAGYGLGGTRRL